MGKITKIRFYILNTIFFVIFVFQKVQKLII